MKKIQIVGILLTIFIFVVPVIATFTVSALEATSSCHNGSFGATTWIPMPGGTLVMIEVLDIERSPIGSYDLVVYATWSETAMSMMCITDSEDAKELVDTMFAGMPGIEWSSMAVTDEEIEVWREECELLGQLRLSADNPLFEQLGMLDVEFEVMGEVESVTETFASEEIEMTFTSDRAYKAFATIATWDYFILGEMAFDAQMEFTSYLAS